MATYDNARPAPPPHLPEANFFSDRIDRSKIDHFPCHIFQESVRSMHENLKQQLSEVCRHDVLSWDNTCADCGEEMSTERLEEEARRSQEMERSDKSKYPTQEQHAKHIHALGVRVDWLVAFTYEHDCWNWPTRVVERDIVKPLTRESRCRYAEKSEFQDFVGPARVFLSHTWEGLWGTLVMAAVSGAREDRHVWIDIFAVRQWKFNAMVSVVCTHSVLIILLTYAQ